MNRSGSSTASRLPGVALGALCLGLIALPSETLAQRASGSGPFAQLNGAWTGAGTMTRSDGGRERIRCRADYNVGGDGRSMQQALRCASDSFRFSLSGNMRVRANGEIEGSWREGSRNTGGSITGVARDGQISGMIDGTGFAAQVSVRTRGQSQQVSLETQGEIRAVSINLRRVP
jgi:hypothetical protein